MRFGASHTSKGLANRFATDLEKGRARPWELQVVDFPRRWQIAYIVVFLLHWPIQG